MANQNNQTVTTKNWVLTILITLIPVVNIIMLFVWAFGAGTQPSKANWAKASLIWLAIFIVLYLIIFIIIGAASTGLGS
jgi:succinate dehydrogenase/fumarate reductase cytochrome b subunit